MVGIAPAVAFEVLVVVAAATSVVKKVIIELDDCWGGGDQASCDGRIG